MACISRVSRALDMKTPKNSGNASEQGSSLNPVSGQAPESKSPSRSTVLIAVASGGIAMVVLLAVILFFNNRSASTPTSVDAPPSPLESLIPDEPLTTWVTPVGERDCPPDFPFKGNVNDEGEKIVHEPKGQFYERTFPERCYEKLEFAEADGFRVSLR